MDSPALQVAAKALVHEQLDGRQAIVGKQHLVTVAFQRASGHFTHTGLVVHDQNGSAAAPEVVYSSGVLGYAANGRSRQ